MNISNKAKYPTQNFHASWAFNLSLNFL